MKGTLQAKESRIRELRSSLVLATDASIQDIKKQLQSALEDKNSAMKAMVCDISQESMADYVLDLVKARR